MATNQKWSHMWRSELSRRTRFKGAQVAHDFLEDPLWDGPDPEPEEDDDTSDHDELRSEPCATE